MATALTLDLGFGDAEEPTAGLVTRIVTPQGAKNLTIEYVKHEEVHPDPGQPRKSADTGLWRSVAMSGILQPLMVRPCPATPVIAELDASASPEDRRKRVRALTLCSHCARPWAEIAEAAEFMLVDGERRWRAAGSGVQAIIPVIVRVDQEERGRRLLTQAAANTGKALTPLEEAELYAEALAGDQTLTHAVVADIVGKSRSSVTDRLALLKNAAWVPLLRSGEITVSQALELSRHADAYPEVHEAAIAYMRRGAELDAVERIADIELAEFRRMVAVAYADHTEAPEPPTVAPKVERAQHDADAARTAPPVEDDSPAEPDERITHDEERESGAETGRKGREPLTEAAAAVDSASSSPSTRPPAAAASVAVAGLFTAIATLAADRPYTVLVAPGKGAGTLRVNVVPAAKKGETLSPLTLEGTAADLDEGIAEAIGEYAVSLAAEVKNLKPSFPKTEKAPAAKGKTTAKKTAAKKTTAKKTTAKKTTAKKTAGQKAAADATPAPDPAQVDLVDAIAEGSTTTEGVET